MPLTSDMSSERLNSVKASCSAAPFGERRSAAWKHFYAAEAAHMAKNTAKMKLELDAAQHLLAR